MNNSWIQSPDNSQGFWTSARCCPVGQLAKGARLKFEYNVGYYGLGGSYSSVAGLSIECGPSENIFNGLSRIGIITGKNPVSTQWKRCKLGRFICGIRTKSLPSGEVTAIELKCCIYSQFSRFSPRPNPYQGLNHILLSQLLKFFTRCTWWVYKRCKLLQVDS